MVDGAMIGLANSLAVLTYFLGCMIQLLPIPWKGLRAHGPQLMMDGIIAQVAAGSVVLVQLLVQWVNNMLQQNLGAPFVGETGAMTLIVSQLTALDASIFLVISVLSTTVVLAPVAYTLSNMFGPILTTTTVALIIWLILQAVLGFLPSIWISLFTLGVVFLAIPFRIGRRLGSTLMASSITAMIMLPLMPSMAIWLESYLGYETAIKPVQDTIEKAKGNPVESLKLLAQLPLSLAGLMVSVVVALVLFPFAYLLIVSMVTKNLSALLGSNSVGPTMSSLILVPAWEMGRSIGK